MSSQAYTFTVVYEHDQETNCICASVPVLDLATFGKDLSEARIRMLEALELHLEGMLEEHIPIPADILQSEPLTVQISTPASQGAPA